MTNKPTVLIGDDSIEFGLATAGLLKDDDFFIITRKNSGKAILRSIKESGLPTMLVLHSQLDDMSAIELILKIRERTSRQPIVIVVTPVRPTISEEYEYINIGADFIMKDGPDAQRLAKKIKTLYRFRTGRFGDRSGQERLNLEYTVTHMLQKIGIPAHIKGYSYIRAAVILSVENSEILESITKQLYPAVAEHFHTTESRVERAVRHAIGIAWERGNEKMLSELFGTNRKKPTNSEFIALLADKIRITYAYDIRL